MKMFCIKKLLSYINNTSRRNRYAGNNRNLRSYYNVLFRSIRIGDLFISTKFCNVKLKKFNVNNKMNVKYLLTFFLYNR